MTVSISTQIKKAKSQIFRRADIKRRVQDKGLDEDADIYDYYKNIDIGRILATQEGPFMRLKSTEEDADNIYTRDSWGRLNRNSKKGKLFEVLETAIKEKPDLDKLDFENPQAPNREDL